ncbi:MAG: hypothetical protein CMJ65_09750 [Planctomycetaceae bacterium]|nr:hypothetical protein [Planctomycetaceae bacterium]
MRLKSWLDFLRHGRPATRAARRVPIQRLPAVVEPLEDRTLLSVTTLLIDSGLSVVSDADDDIAVSADVLGNVVIDVNGQPQTMSPPLAAATVESISVVGGDLANTIDLTGITAADFSFQDIDGNPIAISVDAGNDHDTIIGSIDLAATLRGGDGDDTFNLVGSQADHLVEGGNGNDVINGGGGAETLDGGDGNDLIAGGAADDVLRGGDGQDSLDGETGADTLLGGSGADRLDGGSDDDWLNAGSGNDVLIGASGNDSLLGGSGHDEMFGDDSLPGAVVGDDTIKGQGGKDLISGGGGADSVLGGSSHDTIWSNFPLVLTEDPPPEATLPTGGPASTNNLPPVAVDDTAYTIRDGRALVNVLANDSDPDGPIDVYSLTIVSAPSNSTAFVQTNGLIIFTPAPGFVGTDSLTYTVEDYAGAVSNAATLTLAVQGHDPVGDVLLGDAGNDEIHGNYGRDTITGGGGADRLFGGPEDDRLKGQAGDDELCGGGGADWMTGDAGDDLLESVCPPDLRPAGPELFINDSIGFTQSMVDVLMIIDISGSTSFPFQGSPVGDLNGDGSSDTILDAEIAGFIALNDQLISDGVNARVGIIPFETGATQLDMDTVVAGVQLTTTPTADTNGNGVPDVEDQLRTLLDLGGTNFEPPLQLAETFYTTMATSAGAGVLVFLSDGTPWDSGAFTDEVANLNAMGIDLRAFGVGAGAWMPDLQVIDPNASTFSSTDELTTALGSLGITTSSELDFTVSLTKWSDATITANYATVNGTAVAGIDFYFQSGTVTFQPGEMTQTITILPIPGAILQGGESFFVHLANPLNAVINDGVGEAQFQIASPFAFAGSVSNPPLSWNGQGGGTTVTSATDLGDTMLGGGGRDTLVGADGSDLLSGGGDRDTLHGGDGFDKLLGGAGVDELDGQGGDDTLDGQGAADRLHGGSGDDRLRWYHGSGSDLIEGGGDFNTLEVRDRSGNKNFVVRENPADLEYHTDARMQVGDGTHLVNVEYTISNVLFRTGGGNDTIILEDLSHVPDTLLDINGQSGNDTIDAGGIDPGLVQLLFDGGTGNDTILGSVVADVILGGDGDDELSGGQGRDSLFGGDGDDVLNGDDGDDHLAGEDGYDTLSGGDGDDLMHGHDGHDSLAGGGGNDTLLGDDGRDTVNGNAGDDAVFGGDGSDKLHGGGGDDTLDGGRDDDSLNGNTGNDQLRGGHGNDSLSGSRGLDTLHGGDGDDRIYGGRDDDILVGVDGDDTLNGGRGDDILLGGDGNDVLLAGRDKDIVLGGMGDDYVKGQGGTNDTIAGGEGQDLMFESASEIDENFRLPDGLLAALDAI